MGRILDLAAEPATAESIPNEGVDDVSGAFGRAERPNDAGAARDRIDQSDLTWADLDPAAGETELRAALEQRLDYAKARPALDHRREAAALDIGQGFEPASAAGISSSSSSSPASRLS